MIDVSSTRGERFTPISVTIRTCDSRTVNNVDFGPGPLAGAIIARARAVAVATHFSSKVDAFMRHSLPYGRWVERDGSRVAFDRDYRPLWRVRPDGQCEAIDRDVWIDWVAQCWHFNDASSPWADDTMRRHARIIFKTGDLEEYRALVAEIQSTIVSEWRPS
jgi:hypothetical protein